MANTVSVLRNLSTSGTIALGPKVDFATANRPYHLTLPDVDGDGKTDIVIANIQPRTVSVLRNLVGVTLPLHLLTFNGKPAGNQTQLQWQTATELNSGNIVVEHSTDGINFSAIGSVTAAGNSSNTKNYSFTHPDPIKGVNYYRRACTSRPITASYLSFRVNDIVN